MASGDLVSATRTRPAASTPRAEGRIGDAVMDSPPGPPGLEAGEICGPETGGTEPGPPGTLGREGWGAFGDSVASTATRANGKDWVVVGAQGAGENTAAVKRPSTVPLPAAAHSAVVQESTGTVPKGGPSATTFNEADHWSPISSALAAGSALQFHPR